MPADLAVEFLTTPVTRCPASVVVLSPDEATANAIQAAGSFRPDGAVTRSVN